VLRPGHRADPGHPPKQYWGSAPDPAASAQTPGFGPDPVGEGYAARLRAAGTAVSTVRYDGITHDFLMLNALSDTYATRAAIAQATAVLRNALNAA